MINTMTKIHLKRTGFISYYGLWSSIQENQGRTQGGLRDWSGYMSQRLHGSALGPLHICYGCVPWCSCGTPNSASGRCLWLFCQLLGPFSSYWVALPSLDMRVTAWSYCILLCHVWLMSLGDLLFSGGEKRRKRICEGGGNGRGRGKGSCGWNVLYKRIINFQNFYKHTFTLKIIV